jgi:hypothetical protein
VLSLPDELLENVLNQSIDLTSRIDCHRLSTTCQRFRQILLPRIYREVSISRFKRLSWVQKFFALTPTYGHLCQTLIFHIPDSAKRLSCVPDLLCEHVQYFTMLRVLDLCSAECWPPHGRLVIPGTVADVRPWKRLCAALPQVSELHLRGFTWDDAMDGLAQANMSSVQTLSVELAADELTPEMATVFHRAFSGIVNVSLFAYWHITPAWIRSAFTGRRLTHLAITGIDWATRFPKQQQLDDWAQSIALLIRLNAASLTSLAISSPLCIVLPFAQITGHLPHLDTLAMDDFDFGGPDNFEAVMRPFVQCSLVSLHVACKGVPETFHAWFDRGAQLWPELKTLSLQVATSAGPGDKVWDEADPEEREMWDEPPVGFDMWTSHSRLALESHCADRGINYKDEMDWF